MRSSLIKLLLLVGISISKSMSIELFANANTLLINQESSSSPSDQPPATSGSNATATTNNPLKLGDNSNSVALSQAQQVDVQANELANGSNQHVFSLRTSSSSSLSNDIERQKSAAEPRQDQAPSQINSINTSQPSNHQNSAASNHQNYPSGVPTSSVSSQQQAALINALLERDYHRASINDGDTQQQHRQEFDDNVGRFLSYQDISPSASDTLNKIFENSLQSGGNNQQQLFNNHHNHKQPSTNQMNANLIQNLTASLFPIKQLSNATLLSLSELLNKTRNQQQQQQPTSNYSNAQSSISLPTTLASTGQQQSTSNRPTNHNYQPTATRAAQASQNLAFGGLSNPTSSSQASPFTSHTQNYLDTLLNDQLLDYIRQNSATTQTQSFRAPISMSRFQSPTIMNSNQITNAYSQLPPETPSDLYNTYLPYKDSSSNSNNNYNNYKLHGPAPGGAINLAPAAAAATTNGQALKMAASLYDGYSDQSQGSTNNAGAYRYPLPVDGGQNAPKSQQHHQSAAYQFIQQHTTGNGQPHQLDKIVYHSTPFRPSILNPPSSSVASNYNTNNNMSANDVTANHQFSAASTAPGQRTPNATRQFASFIRQPQQQIGGASSRLPPNKFTGHLLDDDDADDDDHQFLQFMQNNNFDLDRPQSLRHQSMVNSNTTNANNNDQLVRNQSSAASLANSTVGQQSQATTNMMIGQGTSKSNQQATTSGTPQPTAAPPQTSLLQPPTTSTMGPQILFDLYEREIDDQIRDAIYQDHYNHFGIGQQQQQQQTTVGIVNQQQHRHHQTQATNPIMSLAAAPGSTSWPMEEQSFDMSSLLAAAPWMSSTRQLASSTSPHLNSAFNQLGAGSHPTSAIVAAAGNYQTPSSSQLSASVADQLANHQSLDSLAAALHELPTFSASDLQPLVATSGPAYSLIASAVAASQQQSQSPDSSPDSPIGLASLVSQISAAAAATRAPQSSTYLNQLISNRPTDPEVNLVFGQQSQNQALSSLLNANKSAQQQQAAINLPGTILKSFQHPAGQISSILASPFAHLYASLPKYRYAKTRKQPAHQQQQQQQSKSGANSNIQNHPPTRVSGTSGKQKSIWTSLGESSAPQPVTLAPFQLASLLQGPTSGGSYPWTGGGLVDSALGAGTDQQAAQSLVDTSQPSQSQQQQRQFGGLINNLANVNPMGTSMLPPNSMWRQFMAPINWSGRKQQQSQFDNQVKVAATTANSGANRLPLALPLINSLWTSGSSPLSQLFSPLASGSNNNNNGGGGGIQHQFTGQQQQTNFLATPTTLQQHNKNNKNARLRIKILKIPVAVFDNSSPSAGSSSTTNYLEQQLNQQFEQQLLGASSNTQASQQQLIGLMPAHLQPSPTASLLASLPCVHNTNQQQQQQHHQQQQQQHSFLPRTLNGNFANKSPGFAMHNGNNNLMMHNQLIAQGRQHSSMNQDQLSGQKQATGAGANAATDLSPISSASLQSSPSSPSSSSSSSSSSLSSIPATTTSSTSTAPTTTSSAGSDATITKSAVHQMQFFTDINQPNDLQVSPSTTSSDHHHQQQLGKLTGENMLHNNSNS